MTAASLFARRLRALPLKLVLHAVAALAIAGTVHIVAVLVLARRVDDGAFEKLAAMTGGNRLSTFAGPPAAQGPFPYADPAFATAFCLYDLRDGPVRASIDVTGTDYLALSVHTRSGRVVYALTNRSASHGRIALVLMTAAQEDEANAAGADKEPEIARDLRVTPGEADGFVMAEALATTPGAMTEAGSATRKLVCRRDRT